MRAVLVVAAVLLPTTAAHPYIRRLLPILTKSGAEVGYPSMFVDG